MIVLKGIFGLKSFFEVLVSKCKS